MEFVKEFEKFSFGFASYKTAGVTPTAEISDIIIDKETLMSGDNAAYKGIGCISANNSSRLLLDYKALHPEIYHEILRLLFEKNYGVQLSHIKIELGADVNSSSGTEPCTMRYEDEVPDVTRGAGFIFAADAQRINPEIGVDLLRWGQPAWVADAFKKSREEGYKARYKWYISTIAEAYNKLGLKFTHISPDGNETDKPDVEWLIYFAGHLRDEKNPPYDYSKIKIVASDEVGTHNIACEMINNQYLRASVDIIGLHYTTYGDENTEKLFAEYGKEIWYSEGISPSRNPDFSVKCGQGGLGGRNGAVDVANRIINGWYNGRMTMYELQPAIASYYDGSCYYPKQIIKANEPWSGHFELECGFWTLMHFTRFTGKNWHSVQSACFGDGDENHYIENTTSNFITFMPEDGSEFSMILTNSGDSTRKYRLCFENCSFIGRNISVVESCGPEAAGIAAKTRLSVIRREIFDTESFEIAVKPHSIITVTTLDTDFTSDVQNLGDLSPLRERLFMPYRDDFSYRDYPVDFLSGRGNAPLFTTDQGGAFEVIERGGAYALEQCITKDIIPDNWRFRGTPEPITCLGDDSWCNGSVKVRVKLENGNSDNYAGVGLRYNSAVASEITSVCGVYMKLYGDGKWELYHQDNVVRSGRVAGFDADTDHLIGVYAAGNTSIVYIDGVQLAGYVEDKVFLTHGRISLLSAYYRNRFSGLELRPLKAHARYVNTEDALSDKVIYEGKPVLCAEASYKYSNRTYALLHEGDSVETAFEGSGFALCGTAEDAVIRVEKDGLIIADNIKVDGTMYRQAFFSNTTEFNEIAAVKLTVLSGQVYFDSIISYTSDKKYGSFYYPSLKKTKKTNKKTGIAVAAATAGAVAVSLMIKSKISKNKKNR